jgi:calcium-dependent protein kinase
VEEVASIKEGFKLMDINNKGKIDKDELKMGLHKLGHQVPDSDVQILMEAVSNTLHLRSFNHI